jgi:DNA-directed RNA polymerase subunit N (RpoN/RPB10)
MCPQLCNVKGSSDIERIFDNHGLSRMSYERRMLLSDLMKW